MLLFPSSSSSSEFSEEHSDSDDSQVEEEDDQVAVAVDPSPEKLYNCSMFSPMQALVQRKRVQINTLRFTHSYSAKIQEYEKLLNVVVYAVKVECLIDDVIVDAFVEMLEKCWKTHFGDVTAVTLDGKKEGLCSRNFSLAKGITSPEIVKDQEHFDGGISGEAKFSMADSDMSSRRIHKLIAPTYQKNSDFIIEASCITPEIINANEVAMVKISVAQYIRERGGRVGTALLDAASQDGRLDVVQYVCEHCSNVLELSTVCNSIGYTALHMACAFGHVLIVEYLIRKGIDVDIPGGSVKETALHIAIESEDKRVFDCLVDSGKINVKVKNALGETAWYLAARNSFWYGVKHLLEHGHANINDPLGCFQETVMHVACNNGDLSKVKYLMAQGADAGACNRHGETPLHVAVRRGFLQTVKYLIETCHVNVLARSSLGSTALLIACAQGDLKIVQYLIQACPTSVSIPNVFGRTPLQVAEDNGHQHVMCCFYSMVPV